MNDDYKSITRDTFDSVAEEYIKRDSAIVAETAEVGKALEKFASLLHAGSKILDIGSGGGRDSRFFYEHKFKVVGIDFSEKMISGAKNIQPEIDYQVMDFEKLDFPPEEFDGVWANASLHHIPKSKLTEVISNIYKILKKEGLFFIKVKHGNGDGIRENEKFGKVLKRHFSFYEKGELSKILTNAGFKIFYSEITTQGEWIDLLAKKI